MEKQNFRVTAPLTIIAIIVIIAVGAFLVFAMTQKDSPNTSTVSTITQDTETGITDKVSEDINGPITSDSQEGTPEEAVVEKLTRFSDDKAGISFQYPATWQTSVKYNDAPANRPGRKIDTTITITVDSGDTYSVSIPAPEIGFEAWSFENPVKITAADGKVFDRRTGTRTNESSGVNKYFYYAWTPDESTDSVLVMGGGNTMSNSLIDQLDDLIETITVQE